MKIILIHLSDIHLLDNNDVILNRKEQIRNAIQNIDSEIKKIFIVISGDIAFSGLESQYKLAEDFFTYLKNELKSYINCDIEVLSIPGNHDCNFDTDQQIRNIVIDKILVNETEISERIIQECTFVQEDYFNFESKSIGIKREGSFNKLFVTKNFEFDGLKIRFDLYNTAWMSKKNEEQSKLIFPTVVLDNELPNSDLVVSILHHPFNWLNAVNARDVKKYIEKNSDVIMTGHEHNASIYKKTQREGISNSYFEAGVLQDPNKNDESFFNAIIIDLQNKKQKILVFRWNNTTSIYEQDTSSPWEDFQRNKFRLKNTFVINGEFMDKLDDPGASFSHSKKNKINLNDIFCYPELRELKTEQKESIAYLNSKDIVNIKNLLIIGSENIGKSTLAKKLFLDYYDKGFIPILLNGEDLSNKIKKEKVINLIHKKVEKQYSENLKTQFEQLSKDKKVIIVDDFHKVGYNLSGKNQILSHLSSIATNIVILASSIVQIEEVINSKSNDTNIISKLKHYRILPFGSTLKGELIKMWLNLGSENLIEEDVLVTNIFKTLNLVDIILGKNLMPSYPIFILAILQLIEARIPIDVNSRSYVYFYESLITQTLFKSDYKIEIDTKYTFLSFIAYYFYKERVQRITNDELKKIYEEYFKKIKRNFEIERMKQDFLSFNLLEYSDGYYRFKYKYVYYYFTAFFLSKSFDDLTINVRLEIDEMVVKIYTEEYANIILFLTYLSYEKYIIEKILENAMSLYTEYEPCDLDTQVDFLNKIHEKLPELILVEENPKDKLDKFLKDQDELEKETESENVHEDVNGVGIDSEEIEINEILKINLAMKNMQILGQVVKNAPGSLPADLKIKITEESYLLGMRTLSVFVTLLNNNIDNFIKDLIDILKNKYEKKSDEDINDMAKELTFIIVELISLSFIKSISYSIGTEKLDEIYKDLLKKHKIISYELTDLSIKLDHFVIFPENEIFALADKLKDNFFSYTLLKFLVVDYFHLFSTPYKTKQRVCDKLNIPIQKLRILEEKTKKVK